MSKKRMGINKDQKQVLYKVNQKNKIRNHVLTLDMELQCKCDLIGLCGLCSTSILQKGPSSSPLLAAMPFATCLHGVFSHSDSGLSHVKWFGSMECQWMWGKKEKGSSSNAMKRTSPGWPAGTRRTMRGMWQVAAGIHSSHGHPTPASRPECKLSREQKNLWPNPRQDQKNLTAPVH